VWTRSGQQHSSHHASWTGVTVKVPKETMQVRFLGTRGLSYTGDMALDALKFEAIACAGLARSNGLWAQSSCTTPLAAVCGPYTRPVTQLGEVKVMDETGTVLNVSKSSGGVHSSNAADGRIDTLWLDANGTSSELVLDFGSPVLVTSYDWATSPNEPSRDPTKWQVQGSLDGLTWKQLTAVNNISLKTGRHTWQGPFSLSGNIEYNHIHYVPACDCFCTFSVLNTDWPVTVLYASACLRCALIGTTATGITSHVNFRLSLQVGGCSARVMWLRTI
jgi:hypothetical protein